MAGEVLNSEKNDAEQVHVSIIGDSRLAVSWASRRGVIQNLSIVEVAVDGGMASNEHLCRPNSTQYEMRNAMPTGQPNQRYYSPLLLHCEVPVQPGTLYRYHIGPAPSSSSAGRKGGWREIFTPPAAGADKRLRLAVVGDLGQTTHSEATCRSLVERHREEKFDAAILVGDLAYADGDLERWDSFGKFFDTSGCADVPWLVLPGNHEIDLDGISGEAFIPYRKRWRTPSVAPEEVTTFKPHSWGKYDFEGKYDFGGSFYSIRLGPAHMIVLNPYTESHQDSEQIKWLQKELQTVDREITPYLLVFSHAAWHCSSLKHKPALEVATRKLKDAAEPLLVSANASMFFAGHVHAYERTNPIDGIRHFLVGHGGNREQLYNSWDLIPESQFHDGTEYGWGELELSQGGFHWKAWTSHKRRLMDSLQMQHDNPFTESEGSSNEFHRPGSGVLGALILLVCLLGSLGSGMRLQSRWNRKHRRLVDRGSEQGRHPGQWEDDDDSSQLGQAHVYGKPST